MQSPERKIAKLTCLSCKHTFSSSGNLYKHYKTFSDHRPEGKPFISCKEAADEFLDRNLSPYHRKARLREFFNGRLSKEELLELALPQVARMVQTSRFTLIHVRKVQDQVGWNPERGSQKWISCTVRELIQNFSLTPKRTCRVLQFYNDLTSSVDQANKRFNIKRFAPFVQQL